MRHVGTVVEYEDKFEELRVLVVSKNKGFSVKYFISSFMRGLKITSRGQ